MGQRGSKEEEEQLLVKGEGGEVYDYVIRFPDNRTKAMAGERISFKNALDTLLAAYPDRLVRNCILPHQCWAMLAYLILTICPCSGKHHDVRNMVKERWQTRFRLAQPPHADDTIRIGSWESLVWFSRP
jgi:hypothetical protein